MDMLIRPSKVHGTVYAPPSKSMFHRLIICAALSKGTSTINNLPDSDDIYSTLNAVSLLGAKVKYTDDSIIITGIDRIL